jgi:hypothetical protein
LSKNGQFDEGCDEGAAKVDYFIPRAGGHHPPNHKHLAAVLFLPSPVRQVYHRCATFNHHGKRHGKRVSFGAARKPGWNLAKSLEKKRENIC